MRYTILKKIDKMNLLKITDKKIIVKELDRKLKELLKSKNIKTLKKFNNINDLLNFLHTEEKTAFDILNEFNAIHSYRYIIPKIKNYTDKLENKQKLNEYLNNNYTESTRLKMYHILVKYFTEYNNTELKEYYYNIRDKIIKEQIIFHIPYSTLKTALKAKNRLLYINNEIHDFKKD